MPISFSPVNFLSSVFKWTSFFPEQEEVDLPSFPKTAPEDLMAKMHAAEAIRQAQMRMDSDPPVGLRKTLNIATREIHAKAHNNPFLQSIQEGELDPLFFKQYLVDLYTVHIALEKAEKTIQDTPLGHFVFPNLWRTDALAADMRAWGVEDYYAPSDEAKKYAARLIEISKKEPECLISHMYAIYGGLFFGGQSFKYKVQKSFRAYALFKSLDINALGNKYFSFEHIPDISKFKNTWRSHLDAIPEKIGVALEDCKDKLSEEANISFESHLKMINAMKV